MAKINSRAKGKSAEREVIHELKRLLPEDMTTNLERNLEQTRFGGYDIVGLDGWAPEVKRYAEVKPADMHRFWEQAVTQARNDRRRPALFFRQDRREWRVVLRASDVMGKPYGDEYEWCIEISMLMFAQLAKELHDVQES